MPISKILLASLIVLPILYACNKEATAETLTRAPDFTLLDENNQAHTLSDYKDQYVLIYFYPKDDTPGCIKEACSIRDSFHRFEGKNIKVFGISADSPESHKRFKDKYNLPFTLLSDQKNKSLSYIMLKEYS